MYTRQSAARRTINYRREQLKTRAEKIARLHRAVSSSDFIAPIDAPPFWPVRQSFPAPHAARSFFARRRNKNVLIRPLRTPLDYGRKTLDPKAPGPRFLTYVWSDRRDDRQQGHIFVVFPNETFFLSQIPRAICRRNFTNPSTTRTGRPFRTIITVDCTRNVHLGTYVLHAWCGTPATRRLLAGARGRRRNTILSFGWGGIVSRISTSISADTVRGERNAPKWPTHFELFIRRDARTCLIVANKFRRRPRTDRRTAERIRAADERNW